MRAVRIPTIDDVVAARDVVNRHLRTTPVVRCPSLDPHVVLKLETLQPTGSFKVRGGLVAVAHVRDRPIVTASAGNHGLGVACAGSEYGEHARIVIPRQPSGVKRSGTEAYDVQ